MTTRHIGCAVQSKMRRIRPGRGGSVGITSVPADYRTQANALLNAAPAQLTTLGDADLLAGYFPAFY